MSTHEGNQAAYVVVFNATLGADQSGYAAASESMAHRVSQYPGFIREDAFRDGNRLTSISYWRDIQSIRAWREDADHKRIQAEAMRRWYTDYSVFVCETTRAYEFPRRDMRRAS